LAWGITVVSAVVAGGVSVATLGASGVIIGVPFVALGGLIRGREATIESGKMMSALIMESKEVETDPKMLQH
jgi:hypothetical protein